MRHPNLLIAKRACPPTGETLYKFRATKMVCFGSASVRPITRITRWDSQARSDLFLRAIRAWPWNLGAYQLASKPET